jgi:hypothetical protein
LVYGTEAIFPVQLALLVANFLEETDSKPSYLTWKIHNLVELQQYREQLLEKKKLHQGKMKEIFHKKVKPNILKIGELVLKWDAARKENGKHGKFDALWIGRFVITTVQQNNTFVLQNLAGEEVAGGPFNERFLKTYFS